MSRCQAPCWRWPLLLLGVFAVALLSRTLGFERAFLGDGGAGPEYGVLADVGLGHAIHYGASRATPADPFGPYIGRRNFEAASQFMTSEDEAAALSIAETLHARWVATAAEAVARPERSMAKRLHGDDGSARGELPQLGHFRLVWEGPAGGVAMSALFGASSPPDAPYKIFEIVRGAELEVPAPSGTRVDVLLPLQTPIGRRFRYRAWGVADEDGRARIRLSQPSRATAAQRAPGR